MVIAKQMDVRANIKAFFDMAYDGETVVVPRKQNKNVVIISEELFNRLNKNSRLEAYSDALNSLSNVEYAETASSDGSDKSKINSVLEDNLEKLDVIASLKDGWNGNGAPAFPKSLIKKAGELLDNLDVQPEIFPTALQTIQMEFDNSRKDHMEIEIGENETAEVFVVYYNGREEMTEIPDDAESIKKKVSVFYG